MVADDETTTAKVHSEAGGAVLGTTPDEPWGPYRSAVEDRLEACADYVGRLRRSLAGEIAPDRRYFDEKALQLRDAAQSLVRFGQDVEGWLGRCGAEFSQEEDGVRYLGICGLRAGHAGGHDDDPPATPAERAVQEARELADLAEGVSHGLGRLVLRAGGHRLGEDVVPEEEQESLAALAATATELSERVKELTGRLASAGPSLTYSPPLPLDLRRAAGGRSGSLGL